MIAKLPLDSPRWKELKGCSVTGVEIVGLLQTLRATGDLYPRACHDGPGPAGHDHVSSPDQRWTTWHELQEHLLHQQTVYTATFAALPHVVEVAEGLPPDRLGDFWSDIGMIAAVVRTGSYGPPVPADLAEGLDAALRLSEQLAVASFLQTPRATEVDCSYLALTCLVLAGHPVGGLIWAFLNRGEIAEWGLEPRCPDRECGMAIDVGPFPDPGEPPFPAPRLPGSYPPRPGDHPWAAVAAAIDHARRNQMLGPHWTPFLGVAARVATAGVPDHTPTAAAVCLVAAMVAVKGHPGWARVLMLLAGSFRCEECERFWTLADGLGIGPHGTPQPGDPDAELKLPDGPRLLAGQMRSGAVWLWNSAAAQPLPPRLGPVGAVALLVPIALPDGRTLIATSGGSDATVRLWDLHTGAPAGPALTGHSAAIIAMAAAPLPDRRTVLVTSDADGTLRSWDALTGELVAVATTARVSAVRALAPVTLPDGRTLLATGNDSGIIRLRDPATCQAASANFTRADRPIRALAAVSMPGGRTLLASSESTPAQGGDRALWLWDPATALPVTGIPVLDQVHSLAAVSVSDERTLLAAGQADGSIRLWDAVADLRYLGRLPGDSRHMAALTTPEGHSALAIAQDDQVRLLDPAALQYPAASQFLCSYPVEQAITALTGTGSSLIIGSSADIAVVNWA
ncbi:hypothetical protein HS041_30405 [Planomonospora sp. ID67723]|uniref:WD40 repeat domain-containing protein n=1 Tax=Planomonospora sp. ID67723 TaxID=2738134 RepID=UPI0018C3FBA9|nr:hypothetical protein [Planomonospora sp. ID67723]MBG0832020.1 hypothetical protein [Planomonospora sp. ID67723]